ncbi:hypothetical protein MAMMFC1_02501 [Methylomusa anaerophila]|uniref:Uncharacterized protein n=1 Tax=Methylomusa anaerophila TaxID=1930071 RepID=A0A348AL68_9FIRM|nr:hypothetical protein MAMMFC1_02501 [Methylomusa anaerophila]
MPQKNKIITGLCSLSYRELFTFKNHIHIIRIIRLCTEK